MLKRTLSVLVAFTLAFTLFAAVGCTVATATDETEITLSDSGISVDGAAASTDSDDAVYVGADIVYYEDGKDSSYGAGDANDAHTDEEAAAHTVVTITKAGTYRISGTLSAGQLAVDLGDGTKSDPTAVVTLILDGADITCTVAPAVIFYRVYECSDPDSNEAASSADTSAAGANIVLADGSKNYLNGSYVAKIYEEGTTDKLHKYDGALYSKRSMNISGEALGTGEVHITAEFEGLGCETHLTLNGGKVYIESQDDGINVNEDYYSVLTINGGYLHINAGLGAEGDGIDSNGWIVLNGGSVVTMASPVSPDGGVDSYCGTITNGGVLIATGKSNDPASSEVSQPYMELQFASSVSKGSTVKITKTDGAEILSFTAEKNFSSLTVSNPSMALDTTYYVYVNGARQQYTGNGFGMGMGGGMGGQMPADGTMPEMPADGTMPQMPAGMTPPSGERPERPAGGMGGQMPADGTMPELPTDGTMPQMPEGMTPPTGTQGQMPNGQNQTDTGTAGVEFVITASSHSFSGVSAESGASSTEPTAAEGLPFTDVSNSKYLDAIKFVYENNLMNGTSATAFSPNEPVSRAMAITVLARLADALAEETDSFIDVVPGSWYSPYVGWAVKNSIVSGYGDGRYGPDDSVSRQQICVIMNNYAKSKGETLTASGSSFSDSSSIADWAADAVSACQGAGLLSGIVTGSTLSGSSALTRAELADVLMRLAQLK